MTNLVRKGAGLALVIHPRPDRASYAESSTGGTGGSEAELHYGLARPDDLPSPDSADQVEVAENGLPPLDSQTTPLRDTSVPARGQQAEPGSVELKTDYSAPESMMAVDISKRELLPRKQDRARQTAAEEAGHGPMGPGLRQDRPFSPTASELQPPTARLAPPVEPDSSASGAAIAAMNLRNPKAPEDIHAQHRPGVSGDRPPVLPTKPLSASGTATLARVVISMSGSLPESFEPPVREMVEQPREVQKLSEERPSLVPRRLREEGPSFESQRVRETPAGQNTDVAPIQVRIGRVEVRVNQPTTVSRARSPREPGSSGRFSLARRYLDRNWY